MTAIDITRDALEPYQLQPEQVLASFAVDARFGLTDDEARVRLARHGRNELTATKPIPGWRKLLAQFQDPLVLLLLVATMISGTLWLVERESALPYEAIAILAVVVLNALMGYVQQARAEQAVAALRRMAAARAKVIRGGARHSIAARKVVPGDIIVVEEGDTVPADARLHSFFGGTDRGSGAHRRKPAGLQTDRAHRGCGQRGRSTQHALRRHRGDLRACESRRHGDRNADRDGPHRRDAGGRTRRDHTATERARARRAAPRHDGHRYRCSDDRHHHPRGARARLRGLVRGFHPGGRACGGRRARRLACRRHGRAGFGCAADGEAERDRASSRRCRDSRLRERDRDRQDRHAHEERDDRARGSHGERARQFQRLRLLA